MRTLPNPPPYPDTGGIEVADIPDRRQAHHLRRLVLAGSLMAERLRMLAAEIDHASGQPVECTERDLANLWENTLADFRESAAGREPPR